MSLPSFFEWTAAYLLIGALTGAIAAWSSRAGSSPLSHMVSAYRTRAGSS